MSAEPTASREMTPDEIVEAAERMDVVDHAITIPAMWPRLILERERARKSRYYSAPEPDDLQRRCWIIDDGQCRLYNGHEGGHDFGRATPDRADPERRAEGRDVKRWATNADRSAWWHVSQYLVDGPGVFWGPTNVGFAYRPTDAEWLAQAFREAVSKVHDYGTKEELDPLNVIAPRAPHAPVEDADYNCEHPFCVRWWPMVRAAEARARLAALTPPPAGKAVLGTTTTNELEERP